MTMIGITGATGEIGNKVLQILKTKGVSICALVRDPNKCQGPSWDGIEKRPFDITHIPTNIFNNITTLLWILPTNHQNLILNEGEWLQIAKKAGVKHIVKLSVMLADRQDIFYHRESELVIEQLGIAYTHLRPNTFMQNFNNYELESITKKRTLFYPAATAKTSFIDTRDIAAVAAKILLQPEKHRDKAYTLTGAEALSYYDCAKIFSESLGVKISFIDTHQQPEFETEENKQRTIRQSFFAAARAGLFAEISNDVEVILKRKPIALKQYITDYRNLFQ